MFNGEEIRRSIPLYSDAIDSKKRCGHSGEWIGTDQPRFDARHCQCQVEIQARDISDITLPKPCVSQAKGVKPAQGFYDD